MFRVCGGGIGSTEYTHFFIMPSRNRMTIDPRISTMGDALDMRGRGRGRTPLFIALVLWPLTTHPFQAGASFLLVLETPPVFGRSFIFPHSVFSNVAHLLFRCLWPPSNP